MAYSNINKDKEQAQTTNRFNNWVITGFMLVVIFSSISNIWQQWQTLRQAKNRILSLETEVNSIKAENKILERQIEYATSSAYSRRRAKELLGLGETGDVWLKLPADDGVTLPIFEIKTEAEIPTILKWWNLFVRDK